MCHQTTSKACAGVTAASVCETVPGPNAYTEVSQNIERGSTQGQGWRSYAPGEQEEGRQAIGHVPAILSILWPAKL